MIVPAEKYTPPLISLRLCLIVRTSIRKFFFSDRVIFDLSIAFISSNLSNNFLASAASAGFDTTVAEGEDIVEALV
jgi:hypothetical protein